MSQGFVRPRTVLLGAASVLAVFVSNQAVAQAAPQQPAQDAAAATDDAGPGIVVTGFRRSLEAALDAKRNSNLILESVTAEDIGKFPDQNITESLQRLPGVQIDRENGQGTKVRIRGLEQNVTVLNGELFVTGQEVFKVGEGNFTRTDSLESVPSELIGGVEVFKSPNASLLEGGLGGIVNLKTRNPLDLKNGLTVAGNARFNKANGIDGWKPTGALVASYNFNDKFGIIVSGSYSETNGHYDILGGENRGNWAFGAGRRDTATVPTNYYAPEYRYLTDRDQYRTRWGVSVGLAYRPTDTLSLDLEYFHSNLKVDTREGSVKFPFGQGESLGLLPGSEINGNGVLLSGTVRAQSAEAISVVDVSTIKSDNLQFSTKFDNGSNVRATIAATYSNGKLFRDVANNDVRFTSYTVRQGTVGGPLVGGIALNSAAPATFDFTYKNGALPTFGIAANSPQDLFSNPAYGFFKSHWAFGDRSKIDGHSIRGDFAWDVDPSESGKITLSTGFRYGQRKVDFTSGRYLADYSGKGELDATRIPAAERDPAFNYNYTPFGYFQDGAIGYKICDLPEANKPAAFAGCSRFGNSPALITPYDTFTSNAGRVETLLSPIVPGGKLLIQNRAQMVNALKWIQDLYPSTPFDFYQDPLQTFLVKEETKTGYVMADIGGKDDGFHVNVGVRIVDTKLKVDQNQGTANPTFWGTDSWNGVVRDFDTTSVQRSYTDFLPSLNVVVDATDSLKARASASRVVSRQPLFDLGRGFATDFTRDAATDRFLFTSGSRGNAALDPYRAYQFDLGLEYYFGRQGLVSAGFFWKEVDSFVVTQTVPVFVNDQGGGRIGPVSQPVNGSGGRVKGFELAAQYAFPFGLGFTANYTFSDTSTEFANDFDTGLPLPGVSKHSFNGQVYFETHGFAARASYSWRSKAYLGNFGFGDGGVTRTLGIYQRPYGQLDGQISYQVTPNFNVFLEGINLNKENTKTYLQFPELPFRYESGSRRIFAGVRFNF